MHIHSKEWLGSDVDGSHSRQSQIIHKFNTSHLVSKQPHLIELEGHCE
jgi:hypothetical protein